MRHRSQHSCCPAQRRHQKSSLKIRERKHIERPADGQVPLQGEGEDGQHVGVGGTLRQEGPNLTESLSKRVGVLVPVDTQLIG